MTVRIRKADADDAGVIVEFNRRLAAESEGVTLDAATLSVGVRACLGDPVKGVYYLAEEACQVVGQICITYEWSDWRNGWMWWIQSVFVRPEARRRGVFTALYVYVEGLARLDPEVIGLRLYMERDNDNARAAYLRCGMRPTPYVLLEKYPLGDNGGNAIQKGASP